MEEKTKDQTTETTTDQKVGESPSDNKKQEAKARDGKTFQSQGTEKKG